MRTPFLTVMFTAASVLASAQTRTAPVAQTVRITVDDAVKMALERTSIWRPRASIRRSATRASRRRPARSARRSARPAAEQSVAPPASLLFPSATRTDVVTSNVGLSSSCRGSAPRTT